MIKCLTKAYAAHGKKIPKVLAPHSPRHGYHTEAVDYVHGICRGRICGVAATVVNECPICTKILREIYGDHAESVEVDVVSGTASEVEHSDAGTKLWVGMWILHHESAPLEDYGFEVEA